jgi:hypothetical protein
MRGIPGVEALSQRLLHPETFALVMVPALADLQFESRSASRAALLVAYVGVARAFAGAVLFDVARDLRLSIGNPEWRTARREDVSTFAGLVLVQAIYYLALLGIATGAVEPSAVMSGSLFDNVITVSLLLAATIVLPVITVAICFWGGGRPARQ